MNFEEYCQGLCNLSLPERIDLGRDAFVKVYGFIESQSGSDPAGEVILALIKAGVSGDFSCSEEELELYEGIFDVEITYDEFYALTNGGATPKFVENLDQLVDAMPDDIKFAMVTLVGLFLSSDDRLTSQEVGLLARLLA